MTKLDCAFITDKGLLREVNEDSLLVNEDAQLYVVADGIGGAYRGDLASQAAVQSVDKNFESLVNQFSETAGNDDKLLAELVEKSQQAVVEIAKPSGQLTGTTFDLLIFQDKQASLVHLGDSRIALFRHGILQNLTEDHTLFNELSKRNDPITLKSFPNAKSTLTKSINSKHLDKADIKTIDFVKNDIFILMTDGVYRHLSDDELAEILTNNRDLNQACLTIKEKCYQRGAHDNLSVIIVRVN